MWDLPRPGLEPVSPALAGGFLTTAPPAKSLLRGFIAILACLFFYMISGVDSSRKEYGIFIRIMLKLYINFRRIRAL